MAAVCLEQAALAERGHCSSDFTATVFWEKLSLPHLDGPGPAAAPPLRSHGCHACLGVGDAGSSPSRCP